MKNKTNTTKVELVETHNLSLSINRLYDAAPYDHKRVGRALYHALGMSKFNGSSTLEGIRKALELP